MLANGPARFGLVTRALHWSIAALILVQLPLGLRLSGLEPGLANLWLYGLHKSLGMTVFALMAIRLVWHVYSPPPAPLGGGWQALAARLVHWTIYALMFAIPLSGWVASSATGIDTVLFDRITLPAIAPVSEAWESAAFAFHDIATKLFMGLLALHIGAALKREMDGDGTLTRMIRG
ncbi:cytochrome b [Paragemmobacter straminiformis]|uniref:Cytochrome b n=1 Tax=Paragemmobacter straminiformis TaxID=2045119 RepID=A0A842IBT0_9RHOB|nr:cytochrome b [Gemmobacter straminiformis]MBC2837081.1 cytochrome b [Gemmobacter straminiformis]